MAYQEASKRWRRYESGIKPRAAQVLNTVSYAYQKGGASLLDLLSAERSDNDIRVATAQAMADSVVAAATLANARNLQPGSNSAPSKLTKTNHVR